MKKGNLLMGILFIFFTLTSCHNPYLQPNTSKAVSEEKQLTQMKKQTEIMEKIEHDLSIIASKMK